MKTFSKVFILAFGAVLLLSGFGGHEGSMYPNGAPAGYTGSPADGKNCSVSGCHGGTATPSSAFVTSTVPETGYVGGMSYVITVTIPGNGAKGFELSPQKTNGTQMGILNSGTDCVVKDNKYVTHKVAGVENPSSWSFMWTAPQAGSGTVTFYGAFAITMAVTKVGTFVIPEYHAGIEEHSSDIRLRVSPNPVSDIMNVSYTLDRPRHVVLTIYDVNGRQVRVLKDEMENPGDITCSFDIGSLLRSGIYLVGLTDESGHKFLEKIIAR